MKFSEKLTRIMDGPPKISGLELSEKSGISASMISDMRKGRRVPSWEKLNNLVKGLNILQRDRDLLVELWKKEQDSNYNVEKSYENKYEEEKGKETLELYVLGKASAGRGYINFNAQDDIKEIIPTFGVRYKDCFILKVIGDSMEPEILEDSELIIDPNRNGVEENINKIVVAVVNGETYVKVLRRVAKKMYLESINKKYDDIEISLKDEFSIIGKAIEIRYQRILK